MITPKCKSLITHINTDIHHYIPLDKTPLKLELLKKILPMELEDKYLTQTKEYISYDNICVLFIDIVSYTELAKMYEDSVIYKLLNDVYTRFDSITNCYPKLQKIETIGDAYMVVSDIYTNSTDVKSMFLLAVELLKEIKKIPSPNQKELQLRIGIHIGKVAVGILGIEIPRLCIIGNTVNMANRIQTSADADCIQVSKEVYKILQTEELGGGFIMRENVFLKNIGSVTTYITNMAQIDSEDSDSSEYSSLYTN
jgi:guanylate cyclase soluble subunit beta